MYPLVACSVALWALVLDHTVALVRCHGPTRKLAEAVNERLRVGDVGEALSIAAATSGAFATIAVRILRECLGPVERLETARHEALTVEEPILERRLGFFHAIGAVATLLGLLGTITGLCVGSGAPNADASSRATMLAKGISESMSCTFGGLLVGALALAAHLWFRACAKRRRDDWRAESQSIVNAAVTFRARLRFAGMRPRVEAMGYRR